MAIIKYPILILRISGHRVTYPMAKIAIFANIFTKITKVKFNLAKFIV